MLSLVATPVLYTFMDDLTAAIVRLRIRIFGGVPRQVTLKSDEEIKQ